MAGWLMLVTGPEVASDQTTRKRIVAVAAENCDEAFEAARAAVSGGVPTSIGPLAEDIATRLGLTPGKSQLLGMY